MRPDQKKRMELVREQAKNVAPVKQEMPKPYTRVIVFMPSYRQPHPRTVDCINALIRHSQAAMIDVHVPARSASSVIHWARNGMIAEAIRAGQTWDYVLFCDDDMTMEPDYLEKLLSHKVGIVGGICTRRADPPLPNIRYMDKDFTFRIIAEWSEKERLLEVDAVGTGFMLISREALEAIHEYYLRCGWERQTFGKMFNKTGGDVEKMEEQFAVWEAGRRNYFRLTGNAYPFEFLKSLVQDGEYGEDLSFCLKAKMCGIKVYVDTAVLPGHIGDYAFGVDDYKFYKSESKQVQKAV